MGVNLMMESHQTSSGVNGGVQVSELYIRLSALTLLFCGTLMFGFSPLLVMRRALHFTSDSGSRHRVLSLMSSFASGVFLATAMLKRLPQYLDNITQMFSRLGVTLHFPLPEFILVIGFLIVFVVEQILLAFRDQSRDMSYEKEALLDSGLQTGKVFSRRRPSGTDGSNCPEDVRSNAGLRVFLLMFSLCPHAFIEGLTAAAHHPVVCSALVLHEGIVAISLAFRLTYCDLRRTAVVAALLLFSLARPAGMGLAIILSEKKPSAQVRLVQSAVEGLTLGIFINVTVMGLLGQGMASSKHRIHKVAFLLTGFAVITAVLFMKT